MTLHPASATAEYLTEVEVVDDLQGAVTAHAAAAVDRLDPERGVLLAAVWLRPCDRRERPAAHRARPGDGPGVVAGGALANSATALQALTTGHSPAVVREHTSYRRWAAALTQRADQLDTAPFWSAQLAGDDPDLGARRVRNPDQATGPVI